MIETALEIRQAAELVALRRQLVQMDAALEGSGLALARRYEVALRAIHRFDLRTVGRTTGGDLATIVRRLQEIAQMALAAEPTALPTKRCASPDCVLVRGHIGYHNDGLREWGKRPHQQKRLLREAALR